MCVDLVEFVRDKCGLGNRSGANTLYDRDALATCYPTCAVLGGFPLELQYCLFERAGGKGIRSALQVRLHFSILFVFTR